MKQVIKKYKKELKGILLTSLLRGNNVHCNICDKKLTTFIPHLNRINACCPNCGSLERTRLLWYYMKSKGILNRTTTLLHVAPESYLFRLFDSMSSVNYLPIDKFTKGYKYPSKTVKMDVTDLNLESDSIDGIICIHVLEHVVDDIDALKEFYRVLKLDAWAIIQVPFDNNRQRTYEDISIVSQNDRLKHFGQSDHVRIYGMDYINRFKSVGFKVEDLDFEFSIPVELREKHVFKDENIFLLRKG